MTRAIVKAKEESWRALINTIEENPWGIPYKIVMGKLRAYTPGLTETLNSSELKNTITDLFPSVVDDGSYYSKIDKWDDKWNVTVDEMYRAIKEKANNITAPGPDGITIKSWKHVPRDMLWILSLIFTECMKTGKFPRLWKTAKLVNSKK